MYKIADTCVGCHNCAMECPMQAIDYAGLKYEIDQDKCVQCGLCERLCHTASIKDTDEIKPVEKHGPLEMECDLVVCGSGTGMIAAVRAAQAGKKVIVLEKSKKTGGNTDYAHMFFPVYTELHERHGFEDVRVDAVEEFWNRSGKKVERELIETAVYASGEFFDWLLQFPETEKHFDIVSLGEMRNVGPMYTSAMIVFPDRMYDNLLCRDPAIGPGWAGTFIKNLMFKTIREQKLDVEILTEHAAKRLTLDENGAITGVVAEDAGGMINIKAKAVVLATGGMGRSDEKLRKYFGFFDCETPIHRFSVPTDTGDAIDMLQELGVEPDPQRMFVSLFGPAHHPFSYCVYRILEHPTSLWVNLNGERWQDESGGLMTGRMKIKDQPKEITWGIYGQADIDRIANQYLNDPALAREKFVYECYQRDLDEEAALPKPPVFKADTLEELAGKLGIDAKKLRNTVERYNGFCRNGKDDDFGKPGKNLVELGSGGPYYAVYGQRFSEGAFGGLRVNTSCEVTREDGSIIPGLYGVGDATSAMHNQGELAPISELTWATASSYLSGGNAAEYIEKLNGTRG